MWPFHRILFPFDDCAQCQSLRGQAARLAARYGSGFVSIDRSNPIDCETRILDLETAEDVVLLPRHEGRAARRDLDVRGILQSARGAIWTQPLTRPFEAARSGPVVSGVCLHSRSENHTFLARSIARLRGVPLHLLHIAPPTPERGMGLGYLHHAMSVLRALRGRIDPSAVLQIQTGLPAMTLDREASTCGASLLVIGRNDEACSSEDRVYRIVRGSTLPVLIPGRGRPRRHTLEAHSSRQPNEVSILAGGVAHVYNNLLTAILGNASLVEGLLIEGHPGRPRIAEILDASHAAAAVTRKLLAYAGQAPRRSEPVDISDAVRSVLQELRRSAGSQVVWRLGLAKHLPAVAGDPEQIREIVHQLLANAVEATQQTGGRITVSTKLAGNFCDLRVQDTGHGMDAQTATRIFEPFFTTKFPGRGLGLPSVRGIVLSYGGTMDVQSAVGRGTIVSVMLPLAQSESAAATVPTEDILPEAVAASAA